LARCGAAGIEVPVRIGIMLRHLDQHGGGVLTYTRHLLAELLALDTDHDFVLLYRNPVHLGEHAHSRRVKERLVTARSVLGWDQAAVAKAASEERLDLLFNPKYSVPLAARCRTVFVCHGLDWYVTPQWSRWWDRLNHRYLFPRYARKADHIIAVSDVTRRQLQEFLNVEPERITAVRLGVSEAFREPVPGPAIAAAKERFRLPERYFVYCGQIYPPKNFGRLVQAYSQVGPGLGIPLLVAGSHTWLCAGELHMIDDLRLGGWIRHLGWVEHGALPALYAQAHALLLPSLYESFGLPILEAMAAGCPVVTSNRYGTKELATGAAVLVDPEDVDSIAEGMRAVATDADLRAQLRVAGRARAAQFTWERCARETLAVFDSVLADRHSIRVAA
jgi:glycosyltransferase involved in cell wall biosynthesis